jgi:ubiquinone/menaquinone biosynthesis C-methylase UbiE
MVNHLAQTRNAGDDDRMPPASEPRPNRPVTDYFTGLADGYESHRPGYPPEAIAAALEGLARPVRVADVGCGTGICTRMLAAAGAEVIGIEPNADMLTAARRHPSSSATEKITYRQATAETTGLADDSVDLILCAQAFHWFDAPAALAEFRRILLSGGRLALLWNRRDRSDPFMAGYEAVMSRAQDDARARGRLTRRNRAYDPATDGLFTNVRLLTFDNAQSMDRSALIGRARSASYFPKAGPLGEELEARLHRLFDKHERDGLIVFRQNAELTLAEAVRG